MISDRDYLHTVKYTYGTSIAMWGNIMSANDGTAMDVKEQKPYHRGEKRQYQHSLS